MSEVADLIARLRQRDTSRHGYYGHPRFNRDGEEASDTLEAQAAEIERLARERDEAQKMLRVHDHALRDQIANRDAANARAVAAEAERDALRGAASALADLAELNTDDGDEWQAAIAAVRAALGGQP